MTVLNVDDRTFHDKVLQSDQPVLVDFHAPWCGPCRAMSSIVDQVASEVEGKASVVKVNVDEATETAQKFGIESIPAFAIVKGGEVKEKTVGVIPGKRLLDLLQSHLD